MKLLAVAAATAIFGIYTPESMFSKLNRSQTVDAQSLIRSASPLAQPMASSGLRGRRVIVTQRAAAKKTITCSSYPCPAGYFWYYFDDPDCLQHPDTFEAYVEYWNADASFAYDVYAGHASYLCGTTQKNSTVGDSPDYQDCVQNSPWNCNDLGYTWNYYPGTMLNRLE